MRGIRGRDYAFFALSPLPDILKLQIFDLRHADFCSKVWRF